MEKNYEEIYRRYLDFTAETHRKNQRKIRTGLKVNVLLPLVFLIISFITSGSKLIFLVLWIVSLFGIAFYLVYVEYTDHEMQKRLHEFDEDMDDDENGGTQALVGQEIELVETKVNETFEAIDEQIEDAKQQVSEAISKAIEERGARVNERLSSVFGNGANGVNGINGETGKTDGESGEESDA